MAAQLLIPPFRATDASGNPISGAKWKFYITGTLTPATVYSNDELTTSLGSVVTADSGGKFSPIYGDASIAYRAILTTSADVPVGYDFDPINIDALTFLLPPGGSAFVGFSHASTYAAGTVGRSLKGSVRVTDAPFNAVGNGATNDTAAFAAARAVTNRYHIPTGSYVLDASPDPFLDAFTADANVTLIVGGVSYNCSNAFAGPLRYRSASASKMDIVHAKTGNVIQYWQDGAVGTATGFYRGLAFTTDSHFIQAQPATNGGATDILFQRSTLNADPGGNRFNVTFEESTDRLIFSSATTASGAPNFDSYLRIKAGTSPSVEFPAYQPRFSQGWRVTTRADGNFALQAVPATDRVHFRNTDGTITYLTMTQAGTLGFFGAGGITKPSVTGSRGGNAALASLLTALANLGLIFNDTTA